jgi:hypothetical protein
MRMRAPHGLGKQGLPEWTVRMESEISCIAGPPGGFHVTVDRPLWALESGECLAPGFAMNLAGRIDLSPRIWLVPPSYGWSISGNVSG